jgi:hypothetical protein
VDKKRKLNDMDSKTFEPPENHFDLECNLGCQRFVLMFLMPKLDHIAYYADCNGIRLIKSDTKCNLSSFTLKSSGKFEGCGRLRSIDHTTVSHTVQYIESIGPESVSFMISEDGLTSFLCKNFAVVLYSTLE